MDDLITAVINESRRLCESGQQCDYEEFVALVELRETLIEQINAGQPLSNEQNVRLKQLQEFDPLIMGHMQRLKDEAQEAITRVNSSRKQKDAYNQSGAHDSFMFDAKK